MAKDEKDACYQLLSSLNCEELSSYTKQDYYWPKSLYLNYFEEPNILPLKEELYVEENIVLEDYVEVKEQNIEIFEEINEGLVMEEDPKINIIVEDNNEDPIIEKLKLSKIDIKYENDELN